MSRRTRRVNRKQKAARRVERMSGLAKFPFPKGDFDCYVTNRGNCYHPFWCACVNGVWLSGSNVLRVVSIKVAEAMGYEMCRVCDEQ